MYTPIAKAKASLRNFVMPSTYEVSFMVSKDTIKEPYDGLGKVFSPIAKINGTGSQCFGEFLVPNTEEEAKEFENRVRDNGQTFTDLNYKKFVRLSGVMNLPENASEEQILDMFDNAKVRWPIVVEVSAVSKDKDGNPIENWSEIVEWFESVGDAAKSWTSKKDGRVNYRWTVRKRTAENEKLIGEAAGMANVYIKNLLDPWGKPSK